MSRLSKLKHEILAEMTLERRPAIVWAREILPPLLSRLIVGLQRGPSG